MPVYYGPQVLFTRNLLYTGVTRAKNLVVLVGNENALHTMVENNRETMRYSGLREKLINLSQ
jgi:exodeoxyribonuclease V alpha subunit